MRMTRAAAALAAMASTIQGTVVGRSSDGEIISIDPGTRNVHVDTTPRPSRLVALDNFDPVSNLARMFRDFRPKGPKCRHQKRRRPHAAIVHTAQRRARRITRLHAK